MITGQWIIHDIALWSCKVKRFYVKYNFYEISIRTCFVSYCRSLGAILFNIVNKTEKNVLHPTTSKRNNFNEIKFREHVGIRQVDIKRVNEVKERNYWRFAPVKFNLRRLQRESNNEKERERKKKRGKAREGEGNAWCI